MVALLALAAPAFAAAQTFGVNTAADSGNPFTPCNGVEECTLRQAIELANDNDDGGVDSITFNAFPAGQHELQVEAPLPPITEAVRIEGDTAPEATAGVPAIELVPIIAGSAGPGLHIVGTKGTRIEGLAIGGFATGIKITPEESENALETQICGDYIGTEWLGESARPNEVGIELTNDGVEWAEKTEIGGPGCAGNVISGNSVDGIWDAGVETTIAGDRIGIGAEPLGVSLGNGTADDSESAGIYETASASRSTIGGGAGQNLIDGNVGAGVLVEKGSSQVTISENSFTGNAHSGIEILEGAPPAPASVAAESPTTEDLKVTGTIGASTEAGETVRLEVFASDNCSQPGEGRTFLGFGDATPPSTAPVEFSTELPVDVPIDEKGITVTATHEDGATSEFSNCANYAGAPRIFVVNSLGDASTQAACEAGDATCTLRGAIEAANATEVRDTIDFGVAGAIETLTELPEIGQPVTIDGTSAPGYAGQPLVEIKGSDPSAFGIFLTAAAHGSTVSGLAIGGFRTGIVLNGDDQRVCGSYLGVGLDGTTAVPNHVGISIEEGTTGGEVGAGCEEIGDGNLISGNTFGITDLGAQTLIAANRIGVDATGAALPNGDGAEGAGITVEHFATAAIGPASLEGANTIAHNFGPGILVARPAAKAAIRGNSIFENELQGIETANEASVPPKITKVEVGAGSLSIEGEATAAGPETIELDFFASPACSMPGGQTYLGQWSVSGVLGTNEFDAELAGTLPTGEEYITATSTGSVGGQTSEFSECFHYQAPVGEQTFTVDSLEDAPGPQGCEEGMTCTLRGAIEAANLTEAKDTIDFAASAEGVIEIEGDQLPEITEPLEVDGTSAPGYQGKPVVEVDGAHSTGKGAVNGLEVGGAGEATIKGLAVGGFRTTEIFLGGDDHSQVCSSWIGVELDGTSSLPKGVGIGVEPGSVGNEIGVGCGTGAAPDVISGNAGFGIEDHGQETEIGGNLIGISPAGAAMPNEAGGIRVAEEADRPLIGSTGLEAGAPGPNQIAYNDGAGILVESDSSRAQIRANSIFGNEGKGIEIEREAPQVPTIEAVAAAPGGIAVKGVVASGEQEPIELDFFASAVCSPLSAGEGESFLGDGEIALSNPGPNAFVGTVAAPASDDQIYITVTATEALGQRTSEFSECFKYVPPEPEPEPEPEHHEEPKPPVQNNAATPPATPTLNTTPSFTPTNGEKVVVKPEEGKVSIKPSGKGKYVPLEELKEIPVGAVIDATKGRVTLTSIGPNGEEQTAEFFGGVFKVKQAEGSNLVVLELLDETVCKAPKPKQGKKGKGASPRAFASSVSLRPSGRTTGKLWGSGHGNFRTEGHDGSATVRGTIWLVEDRCNGTTFFKTRSGIVSVRDFVAHKTLPLPAGKTYVAGE